MRYELWEYDHGHNFIEVPPDETAYLDRIRQLKLDEPHARHTWTVEAKSWNEAHQALYDRLGWGRYRTIEEDLGESGDAPNPGSASESF
jgi:hypothetical protein